MSIDASTKSSGWAILNEKKELLDFGCVKASSTDLFKRIDKIAIEIKEIALKYNPEVIIMEEVQPTNRSSATFKALIYLQAILMYTFHNINPKMKVHLILPNSWRRSCGIKTGRGIKRELLKPMDIEFANTKFNLQLTAKDDDIADAIGIGYSYNSFCC
jgi:Holliday junction resolvasome RuvABC endonuclease subunit